MESRVLVLYVGGTIGMEKNNQRVYVPSPKKLFKYLSQNVQMHDPELLGGVKPNELALKYSDNNSNNNDVIISYVIKEYAPLLDSSNMSVKDWVSIAQDIQQDYLNYDGFVVLHGTDTLAYTSSALSFMLENLQKPVIITGSQIPIFEPRSDAKDNLLSSLILAGCYQIPEVCVFFANKLLRGNRTTKNSSTMLDAFVSPNYHHLAEVGINITLNKTYLLPVRIAKPLTIHTNFCMNVALISFFPTITPSMLEAVVQCPLEGLVIQSYGAGNIPSNREEVLKVLERAVTEGVLIVNITQCPQGGVSAFYETGKALEDIGVIAGCDMTAESALAKLCYVLGLPNLSKCQRIQMIKTDLRGELTTSYLV